MAKRQLTHQALLMADNQNPGAVALDSVAGANSLAGKTAVITGGS